MVVFRLIFLVFVFNLSPVIWAQPEVSITGRLIHSQTGKPIAGAEVVQKGSFNTAFTDGDGHFSLKASSESDILVFSHPQFKTRFMHLGGDSLQVLMEPLGLQYAPEFGSSEARSFDKLASRVRDFRFYHQMIFLLGNSGNEVRLIQQDGRLVERTLTPAKMDGLIEDCLGNLYIFNADTAYQVFYDYRDIHFINALPSKEFEEYILPCRCYFQGGLIFTVSRRRDLVTSVKYANSKGIVATLKEFADSNALKLLDEKYDREYFTTRGLQGHESQVFMGNMTEKELEEKQEEARLYWFDAYLIRPNKVFAFASDDHFSLYDLKEMKQYNYRGIDEEPEVSSIEMPGENAHSMLRDKVSGKVYVLYKIKSRIRLRPLNPANDDILIDEFPFPNHALLHNDRLYFISNPALDGGNYLFRRN